MMDNQQSLVVGVVSFSLLVLLLYPFLILVISLAFSLGYFAIQYFDEWSDPLDKLVERWGGIKVHRRRRRKVKGPSRAGSPTPLVVEEAESDPLTSLEKKEEKKNRDKGQQFPTPTPSSSSIPPIPQVPVIHSLKSTSSSLIGGDSSPAFVPTPYQIPKIEDISLKIDPRLDASIAKFITSVFDYYVSSEWAPYLTRKQLKLSFKQLLANLGDKVKGKLMEDEDWHVDLAKKKLVPLLLAYVIKVQEICSVDGADLIFPEEKQKKVKFKIRRLCRIIFSHCLPHEDKDCKLWEELCIAVLADGVFWNVFGLGRDQLPELFEYYVKLYFEELKRFNGGSGSVNQKQERPAEGISNIDKRQGIDEVDNNATKSIPFLLDNFLDRKDSLEQADPIVSRWKPTLRDILEETEFLYPLIQYLKLVGGQKAVAYLQAVLDDAPDAKEHCRRVLEIEFMHGFCRSNYFHESMGLSRVEQGQDVASEGSPSLSRRTTKGHSRSASYGSKTNQSLSDILRIEGGVVDGLPICTTSDGPASFSSGFGSSGAISSAGAVEADSFFRRKPQLEDIVLRFMRSTSAPLDSQKLPPASDTSSMKSFESSPKKVIAPRMGIDSKSYLEWKDPEVTNSVEIDESQCNIMNTATDIVMSTISNHGWLVPIISSWLTILQPYLKPQFDHKLEQTLKEFLTVDLFISIVDLINDAFNATGSYSKEEDTTTTTTNNSNIPYNSTAYHNNHNSYNNPDLQNRTSSSDANHNGRYSTDIPAFVKHFLDLLITKTLDIEKLLRSLSVNRDYIFLFFVDVLDLLVYELFDERCDTNMKQNV